MNFLTPCPLSINGEGVMEGVLLTIGPNLEITTSPLHFGEGAGVRRGAS